jgi:hypothetical protein
MMNFQMKRYIYGVSKRRLLLLLILVPPFVFLALSAIRSDRFSIKQDISISKDSPVALASGPIGLERMEKIASHPDDFFQNNFAVRKLYTNLYAGTAVYRADRQFRNLLDTIKDGMSLTMPSENIVRITYHGKEQKIGQALVGYYSQRLVLKAKEGIARSENRNSMSILPKLMSGMEVEKHQALWRIERLLPLVIICIVSLMGVLVLLGVLEWSDQSLKTERQVARYLELPIIGSLPDLNKISAALVAKRSD